MSIGQNFKASGFENINGEDFLLGLNSVLNDTEPVMTIEEAKETINKYFEEVQAKAIRLNKEAGEEFLKINSHKAGVVTLPSGLQYEVIKMGEGDKPKLTDSVRCHYEGTLINGVVFDSSIQRGEPAEFPLQGVIKGWTEGLQLVTTGGKIELVLPADLAYGKEGAGASIPPNATLYFDVEVLDVIPAKK